MNTIHTPPDASANHHQASFLAGVGLTVLAYACLLALILDLQNPLYHGQVELHLLAFAGCVFGFVGLRLASRWQMLPKLVRHLKSA